MLPPQRAEWARAMAVEVEHIESDLAALRWALGCVLTSYREGLHLNRSDLDVSRWLLGLEVLLVFGPGTSGCVDFAYRMLAEPSPFRGDYLVGLLILTPFLAGLLMAPFAISGHRPIWAKVFAVLAAIFGVFVVFQVMGIPGRWFHSAATTFDWRSWMLASVLPCVVCAHIALIRYAGTDQAAMRTHSA
jgi:hypothetical protein